MSDQPPYPTGPPEQPQQPYPQPPSQPPAQPYPQQPYPQQPYPQQPYPQQPYPQQPYPQQPPAGYGSGPKNDGMAIGAMVSSIVGLVLLCLCIGIVGSIVGVVLGFLSRKKIKESGGALTGDGMALAGIIVGIVGIVLFIGLIALSLFSDGYRWSYYNY